MMIFTGILRIFNFYLNLTCFVKYTNKMFHLSHVSKRAVSVVARNTLYVEYLAVIESGTYNYFVSLYGANMPNALINDYINIYFTQLINGVRLFVLSVK